MALFNASKRLVPMVSRSLPIIQTASYHEKVRHSTFSYVYGKTGLPFETKIIMSSIIDQIKYVLSLLGPMLCMSFVPWLFYTKTNI